MTKTSLILVGLLTLSAVLASYLAAYAQERRKLPGAREFILICAGNVLYALGYILELLCTDLALRFWAIRIEYIGLALMPSLFLLFALRLFRNRDAKPSEVYALFALPLITLVLVWTSPLHEMYYKNPYILASGPVGAFMFERGFYFYINAVYQTILMATGSILLFILAAKSEGRKRLQAITLAAGSLLPLINGVVYLCALIPEGIDTGSLALSVAVLIYAFALFKLGLFELLPAARALAIDTINEGLIVLDSAGRLQDLNRAARTFPHFAGAREGEPLPLLSEVSDCVNKLCGDDIQIAEALLTDSGGNKRHYQLRSYPVYAGNGARQGTAVLVSDITEKALLIEQLDTLARTDELTGILNRRSFLELGGLELKRARRRKISLGVLMADIDFFKNVNDQYGHDTGDKVLVQVSAVLKDMLRSIDILGRYGGEEFVALLPGADAHASLAAAERCREAIEKLTFFAGETRLGITISIGVHSQITGEDTAIHEMVALADIALYQAKNSGRNRSCVYESTGNSVHRENESGIAAGSNS